MSQYQSLWRMVAPKTRKQLYTTYATDAYDPRGINHSSMTAVTWYSQILRGPGSRKASYRQYDSMDADIDISRSLDIIAEEMSNRDDKTGLPFVIDWQKEDNQDVADATLVTVRAALRHWSQLQELHRRVFAMSRTMIKFGDCFFRKISDTRKWVYVDPANVDGIAIDELGQAVAYHVKSIRSGPETGGRPTEVMEVVPAAAMVHFSMSDDMGDWAPFGQSVLRAVFRVYRQLAMLEDAVIIYRIVRAPERRVFYIDVGNMNQQQVKRYLESIKTEMRQKRVPGVNTAGTSTVVDGQYDPQSISQDMYFPVSAGGKSSRVETLPGGTEDFGTTLLKSFQEKIFRGLRIPTSYMTGGDAQGAQTNDGKVGIAYIEELRFANFVERLQQRMNEVFDREFKIYLKVSGLNIDDETFRIRLPDPANFALYRQAALDADLISAFNNISNSEYLSVRFILKRYLGLTDDEIQMNEVMVREERGLRESGSVSMIQQIYDPLLVKGRKAPKVEAGEEPSGDGGGGDGEDLGVFDVPEVEPPTGSMEEPAAGEPAEEPAAEEPAPETGEPGQVPA